MEIILNSEKKNQNSWDMNLDFDEAYGILERDIKKIRRKIQNGVPYKKDIKSLAYLIIALFQLRNGCRIGEAIEGMIILCKNKDNFNWNKNIEVRVKVEKTKKTISYRNMVLPSIIKKEDILTIESVIYDLEKSKRPRMRIYTWLKNHYGINTHSLRYAFITKFAEMNTSPQLIAKITGHVNLNHLITYTQKKTADKILRDLEDYINK